MKKNFNNNKTHFENRGRGLLKVEKPRGRITDKYIVISARVFSKNRKVNE